MGGNLDPAVTSTVQEEFYVAICSAQTALGYIYPLIKVAQNSKMQSDLERQDRNWSVVPP